MVAARERAVTMQNGLPSLAAHPYVGENSGGGGMNILGLRTRRDDAHWCPAHVFCCWRDAFDNEGVISALPSTLCYYTAINSNVG
jgi:hypothetical protein